MTFMRILSRDLFPSRYFFSRKGWGLRSPSRPRCASHQITLSSVLCRNPRKGHTLSEILREMWWTVKHHSNCIIGAFGNVFKCVVDYLKRIQVNIAKEIVQRDLFLGLNYKDSIILPLNSNDDTDRCCKVAYHFLEFKGQASPVVKRIPQLIRTVPQSDHM